MVNQYINKHTKKYILDNYNQIDIFTILFEIYPSKTNNISKENIIESITNGSNILSPLRYENRPSVYFYYDDKQKPIIIGKTDYYIHGKLKMKDCTINHYSTSHRFWGDCFDLAKYILCTKNETFNDVLIKLIKLLEEGSIRTNRQLILDIKQSKKKVFNCVLRKWNMNDAKIWNKFSINSIDLESEYILPISSAFINKDNIYNYGLINPAYVYYSGKDKNGLNKLMFYFPFRKKNSKYSRFIKNHNDYQGLLTLEVCDFLIITKSLKDVIVIKKILKLLPLLKTVGVIAVPSENHHITQEEIIKFKTLYNVKEICIFYDNDFPGMRNLIKVKLEHNIYTYILPKNIKVKDSAEYVHKYGFNIAIEYTIKLLKKIKLL